MVIMPPGCLMARGALARREMRRFLPGRRQFRGLLSRFGAKCSLALHKETPTRRNIVLNVADKQPVSP